MKKKKTIKDKGDDSTYIYLIRKIKTKEVSKKRIYYEKEYDSDISIKSREDYKKMKSKNKMHQKKPSRAEGN